ncbi:MAG TPA: glucose-6-phosphate dehydrogenase assembly protein OpcA [Roseiflexaceae bacterium]|nr:glucose-6-phosphate dehydrogenase assembly protein OpcA [Roseiflexaceae bacterium]
MSETIAPLAVPTSVDIRAIERELTALWQQAHENNPDAVTRVCVLNLVAVVRSGHAAEAATETVARLNARHPNRAILVSALPEQAGAAGLEAWVQAHCRLPAPGRPQVCCEQITITARGAAAAGAAGVVLPLLVPDVPVMLWWPRGEPFGDPLFDRVAALADRIILDSASFDNAETGLAHTAGALERGLPVSDMAWGRLTPWRELTAQFFDAPALLPHLAEIDSLEIEFETGAGGPPDRSPALLMVGWLASRLGWHTNGGAPLGREQLSFELRRADGAPVTVQLRPAPAREDLLDRLASLTLICAHGRFSITRGEQPESALARADVEGMAHLERVVRLERHREDDLLAEELRLLGHDHGYEGALRAAAVLLGG